MSKSLIGFKAEESIAPHFVMSQIHPTLSFLVLKQKEVRELMKKKTLKIHNQEGFTLIELMVVLGLISTLAMMAMASYETYVRRAYVANAKSGLAQLYTMEMGYSAEYNSFTSRLDAIGFSLQGHTAFDMGFDNDQPGPPGTPQGNAYCNTLCNTGCPLSGEVVCMAAAQNSLDGVHKADITRSTFRAVAHLIYHSILAPTRFRSMKAKCCEKSCPQDRSDHRS